MPANTLNVNSFIYQIIAKIRKIGKMLINQQGLHLDNIIINIIITLIEH